MLTLNIMLSDPHYWSKCKICDNKWSSENREHVIVSLNYWS